MIGHLRRFFSTYNKALNLETISPRALRAEYAVTGEVTVRAGAIKQEMADGKKFPFDSLTYCHIGNPQSLLQKPLTWVRQVLSLLMDPSLL